MKRTWRDNPKKNPAARRKRPAEVVEMSGEGGGIQPVEVRPAARHILNKEE